MSDAPLPVSLTFADLGLPESLLKALSDVGYESPSPIQAATIPPLLAGRDLLGQAQTGTGKTAAFALPILAKLQPLSRAPQALVLAPTRELAIQVAEAFQKYAHHLPGFHVAPIYGGSGYGAQISALRRGVHVVIGTPGRIIDHIDKGTLDLSQLRHLVLDEADEMLRMGFIDDVEKILQKTPASRQIALFSATMPESIRRIAHTYLKDPAEVKIQASTQTAQNITQRYWLVSGLHKLDALTRILETETFDAMIVFARTKVSTEELADKLEARGFRAAAINGDMQQAAREKTIQKLKAGDIDILVATDVAARGLDVERISHVFNFDIPYDTESYVHRIGRTGRAGRAGEAILFVTPRERGMLRAIERATRQPITQMQLPTVSAVNDRRIERFKEKIIESLAAPNLIAFQQIVESIENDKNVPAIEIAAALARLYQGGKPLLLDAYDPPPAREYQERKHGDRPERSERPERPARGERTPFGDRPKREYGDTRAPTRAATERPKREFGHDAPAPEFAAPERPKREYADRPPQDLERPREPRVRGEPEVGMETFRIEVGHEHGVKPGNIVGAVANEIELDSKYIGRIDIRDDHTYLDLPEGMPDDVMDHLRKVRVAGQMMRISRVDGVPPRAPIRKSTGFDPDRKSGGFDPSRKPPRRKF
ncbi:MAG TPA: DEAD/DEAH box helicase [Patescibacteria group bacterium]|nr:DEAD/DEAH box helicase [Patescibacteria group bacterium]